MDIAKRYEGVATEDKGYSLALHYRLALEQGLNVVDDVFRALQGLSAGICTNCSPARR